MATMSMNRVIHGAVRRDLDRFVDALSALRPGDTDRARDLTRAFEHFDAQLTDHHEGEHAIAWPAFESIGVPAATIELMDVEHEAMAAALAAARAAMRDLAVGDDATRQSALSAMEHLREVTHTHLEHEEHDLEPIYLSHHDGPEMKAMSKQFARRGGLKQAGDMMAWLQDGASPEMRAGLRDNVPGPVVTVLSVLLGRGYAKHVAPVWAV